RQILMKFVRRVASWFVFRRRSLNSVAMAALRTRSPAPPSTALAARPVASRIVSFAISMFAARRPVVSCPAGLVFFRNYSFGGRLGLGNAFDNFLRLLFGRAKNLMPQTHGGALGSRWLFDLWSPQGIPLIPWTCVDLLLFMTSWRALRPPGWSWRR